MTGEDRNTTRRTSTLETPALSLRQGHAVDRFNALVKQTGGIDKLEHNIGANMLVGRGAARVAPEFLEGEVANDHAELEKIEMEGGAKKEASWI